MALIRVTLYIETTPRQTEQLGAGGALPQRILMERICELVQRRGLKVRVTKGAFEEEGPGNHWHPEAVWRDK